MKKYLKHLVAHEMDSYFQDYCSNPRNAIILLGGVALNSLGDFLGNEDAIYKKETINIDDLILTGSCPDINEILIDKCQRDPKIVRKIISSDKEIKSKLTKWASFGEETILVVDTHDGKYKPFDGMHRIIGHILTDKKTIHAYVLKNYGNFLPNYEPHVAYDLIRAYQKSARTIQDKDDLRGALRLIVNNTGNMKKVLQERFNKKYLADTDIQDIIQSVTNENKYPQ